VSKPTILPADDAAPVATARHRQLHDHGYTAAHDDHHGPEELVSAAVTYAINTFCSAVPFHRQFWPWDWSAWKPTPADPIHQLTKAGALIAAAIDALQRRSYQCRGADVVKPDLKRGEESPQGGAQ